MVSYLYRTYLHEYNIDRLEDNFVSDKILLYLPYIYNVFYFFFSDRNMNKRIGGQEKL